MKRIRAASAALGLALLAGLGSTAAAAPVDAAESQAVARGTVLCDRTTYTPRVRRVFDMNKDIVVHRRSNHTLPQGTHTKTTKRRATVKTRVMAGASLTAGGSISTGGLAGKVLGKAEAHFGLELVASGSRTWETEESVRIGYRVTLKYDTSYVFFRGVERVSGRYTYRGCLDDGDGDRIGVVGIGRGRWVSWEDTESGAVSCGNPNRTLSNIAEAARDRGCN